MNKRLEVLFSGCVQGVGFRLTAESLSRKFPVTGFVRNLSDGKVEVVAEGDEQVLTGFLEAIKNSGMSENIRDTEVNWKNAEDIFIKFMIER